MPTLQEQYDKLCELHAATQEEYAEANKTKFAVDKAYREAKAKTLSAQMEIRLLEERVKHEKKMAQIAAVVSTGDE